jgi:hypothetical protein
VSDDQARSGIDPAAAETPSVLPVRPQAPRGAAGRNVLLVVAAAIVLLAIVGVVAYVILTSEGVAPLGQTPQGPVASSPGTGTPAPGSTAASGTLPPLPDIDNRDVFTPRNPFKVIPPAKIEVAGSSNTSETPNNSTTLTLKDIITRGGQRMAVVKLGGITYTVGAGDTIGASDWKVVRVDSGSVVFLFGDERVTIRLGQTASK